MKWNIELGQRLPELTYGDDRAFVIPYWNGVIAGVFDGHGGSAVSSELAVT
jgi:serine/threonine protein phosphatase PrpC